MFLIHIRKSVQGTICVSISPLADKTAWKWQLLGGRDFLYSDIWDWLYKGYFTVPAFSTSKAFQLYHPFLNIRIYSWMLSNASQIGSKNWQFFWRDCISISLAGKIYFAAYTSHGCPVLKVIERTKIYCKYLKVDLIQEIQITLVKPYIGLLTSKMKISSANMENMSEK